MNRSDRLIFKTWEQEMITAEKEKALNLAAVAIKEEKLIDTRIQAKDQNIQAKLQVEQTANQQAEKLVVLNAKLAASI